MRGISLGTYGSSGTAGYGSAILSTPGLVAYYPMQESGGSTCADATGVHNGTNNNVGSFGNPGATSKLGTSYRFLGSSNSVSVPYAAALAPSSSLSVECWLDVRDTTSVTYEVVCKPYTGLSNPYFDYCISTGRYVGGSRVFSFFLSIGTTLYQVSCNTVPVTGTFYHVVGTYDGSFIRIYMNGALDCTPVAVTGSVRDSGTGLYLGSAGSWSSEDFDGYLQHVSVYNTALSAGTVLAHYNVAS